MSAFLEREYFKVSQDNRYFTLDGLSKMIGQQQRQWRHAALKELLDNALDAAESVHPAVIPVIDVEFTETETGLILTVADNGNGISPEQVDSITDFSANSGTKIGYRAPTRGAQGNATKTLIGIPVALGQERGHLQIEAQGVSHTIQAWLTPIGPEHHRDQKVIDTQRTRVTVHIPGTPEQFNWNPRRWITAYSLFNPHAQLQIRKIDPVSPCADEINGDMRAYKAFSGMSLTPTVDFPDPWRKFLPTDHTPAHWYSADEFQRLVYLKRSKRPEQALSEFVQEFKGLSRTWRKVCQNIPAKTLTELANHPPLVAELHQAMLIRAKAPKPDILGRVGPDHFQQRFDDEFVIKSDHKGKIRYWYKHQWAMDENAPYLIEVAIAETETTGGIFYGLNYSVPFNDPLAETLLIGGNGKELIEGTGLESYLRDAGAYSGTRFGKAINTAAAVHLVMPLLPTLDMGKTRLDISPTLAKAIAETIAAAAKVLHKEIVDARLRQNRLHEQVQEQDHRELIAAQRELHRQEQLQDLAHEREERDRERQRKREEREREAEQRRLRGELPTQKDVVFSLILPCYTRETKNETIYVSNRDLYYAVRHPYSLVTVRPGKNDNTELEYGYFMSLVKDFREEVQLLPWLEAKARGTLFEPHSGKETPVGDRELRDYQLPNYPYAGILVIEKEGVWRTLRDTGGMELVRKYDLMVLSMEGYNVEAGQKLLAKCQQEKGYKIFCFHDADPYGYNICRVLAEPTKWLPDHSLDVIDIGLSLDEGLKMELQTEYFMRKNALPDGIIAGLSDQEIEKFTGTFNEKTGKWRCERIEINAIPIDERADYLDGKLAEHFQAKPNDDEDADKPIERPSIEAMTEVCDAFITEELRQRARETIESIISLDAIEAATLETLPKYDVAHNLQNALDTDPKAYWRDVVKQTATETVLMDQSLSAQIQQAVDQAISAALTRYWTHQATI